VLGRLEGTYSVKLGGETQRGKRSGPLGKKCLLRREVKLIRPNRAEECYGWGKKGIELEETMRTRS